MNKVLRVQVFQRKGYIEDYFRSRIPPLLLRFKVFNHQFKTWFINIVEGCESLSIKRFLEKPGNKNIFLITS